VLPGRQGVRQTNDDELANLPTDIKAEKKAGQLICMASTLGHTALHAHTVHHERASFGGTADMPNIKLAEGTSVLQ